MGEEFFVDGGDDDVIRVDHFVQVDLRDFGQQFVGVESGEAVVRVNPGDQFGEGDAEGVVEGAIGADGHDGIVVLEAGPVDLAAFDDVDLHACGQRHFDGGAGDFAVAHGGVTVAHEEQGAWNVDGKVQGVSD